MALARLALASASSAFDLASSALCWASAALLLAARALASAVRSLASGQPIKQGRGRRPGQDQDRHGRAQARYPGIAPAPAPEPFGAADRPGQNRFAGEEAAEIFLECVCGSVAPGGIFLQALQANRFEITRYLGLKLRRRNRLLGAHLLKRVQNRRGAERRAPGHQLVEDASECVEVGTADRYP